MTIIMDIHVNFIYYHVKNRKFLRNDIDFLLDVGTLLSRLYLRNNGWVAIYNQTVNSLRRTYM